MIKNKINFAKLFFPVLWFCGGVALLGLIMLLIFGGNTAAQYTLNNLRTSLFVKALVSLVLVVLLTTGYFFIRFSKNALWVSLYTAASVVLNSITAFFLCVITRAPLGELTFAVVLLAVLLTYATSLMFMYSLSLSAKKKKKTADAQNVYMNISTDTFGKMLLPLMLITVVIVCGFVLACVFSAPVLMLYALPAIITAVSSVIITIAFGCRLFLNKM